MPSEPLPVIWQKNAQNSEWFDFLKLDLEAPYFKSIPPKRGVFLIWYAVPNAAKVIVLGSGNLLEQFRNLRGNPNVIQFSNNGPLKVSWVVVNGVLHEDQIVGVEAFLFNAYKPIFGTSPSATPIPVKLIGQP